MSDNRLHKLYKISEGQNRRFPGSDDPFRTLARLLEECGEMAEQVHVFQDIGLKRQKCGLPNKTHLAKEAQDIITAVLNLVMLYGATEELDQMIEQYYQRVLAEGLVTE